MTAALALCLRLLLPMPAGAQEAMVKDDLGRLVSVPGRVDRVLSLQPELSRIIVALGAGSSFVGRDHFLAKFDHLFPVILPGQESLPVVSPPDGFPNLEMVLRLDPDLILASPSEAGIPGRLQAISGKPVLAFSSMGRLEALLAEVRWLGAALGREERAARLTDYSARFLERVKAAVSDLPETRRPRAYLSFWGSLTRTPVSYDPVTEAGARNLAQGLLPARLGTVAAEVSIEKILAWDPDVILVHGSIPPAERRVTVSGILDDLRLRSVQAVKDRRVFYTFGFWHWWDPALVLVETLMLAALFHPDRFPGLNIDAEGDEVFRVFYGIEGGFRLLKRKLRIPDGPWR